MFNKISNPADKGNLSFRWIAESFPALACYVDTDLTYQFMNNKYKAMFKLEPDVNPSDYTVPTLLGGAEFDKAKDHVKSALAGNASTFEVKIDVAKQLKVLQIHYVPDFIDENNHSLGVNGFFMMGIDVTELRVTQANFEKNLITEVESKTNHLSEALKNLKNTQDKLVEQEKMASLGSLVAGVAHELNTPIGIALTAVTSLHATFKETSNKLHDASLSEKSLTSFLNNGADTLTLSEKNLARAATLIRSFQSVSVSQNTELEQHFNMLKLLDDTINSLKPRFSTLDVEYENVVDENLVINSYSGLLFQVLSNLIINSNTHGFGEGNKYTISISVFYKNGNLTIHYEDNGSGLSDDAKVNLFEPFFTSKTASENSGLGMTIIYNIIQQNLKGTIDVNRTLSSGMFITITFPTQRIT